MKLSEKQEKLLYEINSFSSWKYKKEDYSEYVGAIREYLLSNALNFDEVRHCRQGATFEFNGIEIAEIVETIMFDYPSNNPYIFWEYFNKPIFYYGPAIKKDILNVINNNEEVMSFKIDLTEETYQFYKQYINGNIAYAENYDSKQQKVVIRMYDVNELKNAIQEEYANKKKIRVESSWRAFIETPASLCDVDPKLIISIELYHRNDELCYLVVTRDNEKIIKTEKLPLDLGETVYSAYKKYMNDNGYLVNENNSKIK